MRSLDRKFGISTHLFHEQRLSRDHLVDVAAHGFEAVEVFATRSHFDYRHPGAVAELREWLGDTGLELHSVHAPAFEAIAGGKPVGPFSTASGDEARRRHAIEETRAALEIARTIPFRYLVVHLGMHAEAAPQGDNQPASARRSVEDIVQLAAAVDVQVALEVIPNPLSSAAALCRLIEEELEGIHDLGVCLDYGHANLGGDVAEAVETLSGHIVTTHLHDNGGRRDDHLVPYAGRIDWDTAMMSTQKVGYDGVFMLEVGNTGDAVDVLRKAAAARQRLEKTFVTF